MKVRKTTIVVVMALFMLIIGVFYLYETYFTKSGEWKINWDFQVPQPSSLTTVYEIGGFQDYEGYHIGTYSDWKLVWAKKSNSWEKVGADNLDFVKQRIKSFEAETIDMSFGDEKQKYSQLFKNTPVNFDKDSLWYWKEKRQDHYFLAVLNPKTKKLYVLERAF